MQAWYTLLDADSNPVGDRRCMTRVASADALTAEDHFYVDHAAGVLRFGPCEGSRWIEYTAANYQHLSECSLSPAATIAAERIVRR